MNRKNIPESAIVTRMKLQNTDGNMMIENSGYFLERSKKLHFL